MLKDNKTLSNIPTQYQEPSEFLRQLLSKASQENGDPTDAQGKTEKIKSYDYLDFKENEIRLQ